MFVYCDCNGKYMDSNFNFIFMILQFLDTQNLSKTKLLIFNNPDNPSKYSMVHLVLLIYVKVCIIGHLLYSTELFV